MKVQKYKTKKLAVITVTAGLLAGAGAGLLLNFPGGASASSPTPTTVIIGDANEVPDTQIGDAADNGTDNETNEHAAWPEGLRGKGPHGKHGDHRGGRGGEMRQAMLDTVATAIGITPADLLTAIQGGKTIAQVATENGKTVQSVIDALVTKAIAGITERITNLVNGVAPTPPAA